MKHVQTAAYTVLYSKCATLKTDIDSLTLLFILHKGSCWDTDKTLEIFMISDGALAVFILQLYSNTKKGMIKW